MTSLIKGPEDMNDSLELNTEYDGQCERVPSRSITIFRYEGAIQSQVP